MAFMFLGSIGFLIAGLVFSRTRFTGMTGDHDILKWWRLRTAPPPVGWERLPRGSWNYAELNLLLDLLHHDRELVALVSAMQGVKLGVLAVTDNRLIFVRGIVRAKCTEIPLSSVRSVTEEPRGFLLELPSGRSVRYGDIRPKEEVSRVVDAIRQRAVNARAV